MIEPLDVTSDKQIDEFFEKVRQTWGKLDFFVHSIAFANKASLRGRFVDTTRGDFHLALDISCYSFVALTRRAAKLMEPGGSVLTLSYQGAVRAVPNYNVMGAAKAALEASVRYLATDYGSDRIRVNAISAGPVRTLAGAGIADARLMFGFQRENAPLRRSVTIEDVGGAAVYLLSDLSSAVTGEIHYVDAGYNSISMPRLETLKGETSIPQNNGE